jgi:serine/threonine protein kinase
MRCAITARAGQRTRLGACRRELQCLTTPYPTSSPRVGEIARAPWRTIKDVTRSADQGSVDLDDELEDATEIVPVEALSSEPQHHTELGRLGDYLIDSIIGEGGGGKVYSAHHRVRGGRVAIKVLRPEMVPLPHLVTRFNREVEAINKIRHPNIVQVFETGETERGQPYYVMELLEGMNLRRLLQLHGRFSPAEVLELIEPICHAVQAVHDAGFIHRDIKASNVLVVDANGERSLKLLDFGIAKTVHGEAGPGLTEPGARLGSAHNMAPEQVRCEKLDARADIYALGVVIFQLLTGEYPFHAEDPRAIALLHLQAPPPRPSARAAVSPAVDAIVLRCLEKQAERRYASCTELLASLRATIGERPSAAEELEARAIGIYVELSTPEDAELDDAMIEDISIVLDSAEQCLTSRSFAFPLRTMTALLGVRLPEGGVDPEQERGELSATISEMRELLADRPDAHPDVHITFSLRIDSVRYRAAGAGPELVGGALLDVGSWSADHRIAS